ncbi:hypothetical protein [Levilactobacillus wangkuiensis]|uniref:hypothetical protein n=1 Tax=Levilactobacillus wangkuiensis TaxID=2799566 RepID=UPI00194EB690|nr:hypothetical protein [Levilactobacillus wangkuiensis]
MKVMKTSRNIRGALNSAIHRSHVFTNWMAKDTAQSPQTITNGRHTMDTTPDNAVRDSVYLRDSKFNSQLAAIFFESVAVFDTRQWSEKFRDSPYATWWALRSVEHKRLELGDEVDEFIKDPRSEWSDDQKKEITEFMTGLQKTISLASLLTEQVEEVTGIDLVKSNHKFNESYGDLGGERCGTEHR